MLLAATHLTHVSDPALRPYVLGQFAFDQTSTDAQPMRRYPMPFVVLVIHFGSNLRLLLGGDQREECRPLAGFVAGLSDTYVDVDCPGQLKGIQVSLTPTGARRLIGMPLSVLRGRVVSLEDLFPSTRATLIDALESAPDWRTRFKIVEAFIAGEVSKSRVDTGVVDWAVANIVAHNGVLATGELAKELGYSNKHLISLFHEQVGVPPKLMARLVRLHRVMWRIASEEDLCWADLAASHGFCDQAHLGREIRRLSGLTPRQAHTRLFGLRNLLR